MNIFQFTLGLLADTAVKGVVILLASELVFLALRKGSAALRHSMRLSAVLAVLVLPVAQCLIPAAPKALWSLSSERISGNEVALTLKLAPGTPPLEVAKTQSNAPFQPGPNSLLSSDVSGKAYIWLPRRFAIVAVWIWLIGLLVSFAPLAIGRSERRRLARSARLADPKCYASALIKCRELLGIRGKLSLLESADEIIPLTWGTLRPVVLLPTCARRWSEERIHLTLLHELAHVQRRDCLTQAIGQLFCALHWFNPLAWRAARAMRLDREQACDDVVLMHAHRASIYAEHLVEIAAGLRPLRISAGIPIARRSRLEERVSALLVTRSRRVPGALTRAAVGLVMLAIVTAVAAQKPERSSNTNLLRERQMAALKEFSARKERQAEALVEQNHEKFFPEFREFFGAAKRGDWQTVTNMYVDFRHRHGQYSGALGDLPHTPYWQTVLETCLAYADVTWGEPEHIQLAIDGFLNSIPAGAVYFGGTDPGRGFPTAFSRDHAAADPFFTLTQNALADATYLAYLRTMYGSKLYVATEEDSQNQFADYIKDATARFRAGQLKPGENVSVTDNRTSVSGQIAVMEINARLARIIFEKNPGREFYIEESFPLEWMYPYLVPNGQVMRINRKPLATLSDATIQQDRQYWNARLKRFLGAPLPDDLSTTEFLQLMEKIYVKHQPSRGADAKFFSNDWAQRAFSKWRSGIAGVYVWRSSNAQDQSERDRMSKAAEHALRDAYALCPISREAVHRYTTFLNDTGRAPEATLIEENSAGIAQSAPAFRKSGPSR